MAFSPVNIIYFFQFSIPIETYAFNFVMVDTVDGGDFFKKK